MKYTIFQMPSFLRRQFIDFDKEANVKRSYYTGVHESHSEEPLQGTKELNRLALLDRLFHQFNIDHPEHYAGASMSAGDVVMIEDHYYLC